MGDHAARSAFIRHQQRIRQRQETISRNNGTGLRFCNLVPTAGSIDSKRVLRTEPALANILTNNRKKKTKDKKDDSWLDKLKRVHARKFSNYFFNRNNEYEFAKPKEHHSFFEGTHAKKQKHMTKHERLKQYKFFGKVFILTVHFLLISVRLCCY